MKKFDSTAVTLGLLALILSAIAPTLRQVLKEINYIGLSEKSSQQEILVEVKNPFDQLSIRDFNNMIDLLEGDLFPLFSELNGFSGELSAFLENANGMSEEEYGEEAKIAVREISNIANDCRSRETRLEREFSRKLIGVICESLDEGVRIAKTSSDIDFSSRLPGNPSSRFIRLDSKINTLVLQISGFMFELLERIKTKGDTVGLYRKLENSITDYKIRRLVDLETPYFSLPSYMAEEKEKEILTFLGLNYRNPTGTMALLFLYLEMRNFDDAYALYAELLHQMHLSGELQELKVLARELLRDQKADYERASLRESSIFLDGNYEATITERYRVNIGSDELRVIVMLPFSKDSIELLNVVDQSGNIIPNVRLDDSWKESAALHVFPTPARDGVSALQVTYRTNSFVEYREGFGTYRFRYGGSERGKGLICRLSMPSYLRIVSFRQRPQHQGVSDGEHNFEWNNPLLPMRISALRFVAQKSGISGEFISHQMLYLRLALSVFPVALFFICTRILRSVMRPGFVFNLLYFVFAICVATVLMWDITFVERLSPYLSYFSTMFFNVLVGISWLVFAFSIEVESAGEKKFKLGSTVFEVTIGALLLRRYIELQDTSQGWSGVIFVILGFWILLTLFSRLARELDMSSNSLILVGLFAFILLFAFDRQLYEMAPDRNLLDYVGLLLIAVLLLILGVFYLAYTREIKNRRIEGFWDEKIELLAWKLQDISKNAVQLIIVCMVVVSLVYQSAVFGVLVLVGIAVLNRVIDRAINWFDQSEQRG